MIERKFFKICLGFSGLIALCALTFVLAQSDEIADTDGDQLPDDYEIFFGLDVSTNEACLDYDNDELVNYGESLKLTDPFEQDTDRDGFNDLVDSNAVSRAYIRWGDPHFTHGDQYEYPRPDFCLGAYKVGGEWVFDPVRTQSAWYATSVEGAEPASLNIDLDRNLLTNSLRFALRYKGRSGSAGEDSATESGLPSIASATEGRSALFLDLLDTNGLSVLGDQLGTLLITSNSETAVTFNIPTAEFRNAAVIQLRQGDGEVYVLESLVYIDEDEDGLDADQEKQIGFSDYSVDSNGNGTNDFDECFNSGSSTNIPGGTPPPPPPDPPGGDEDLKGVVIVDKAQGNDAYSGRLPYAAAGNKGPKKYLYALGSQSPSRKT